MTCPVCGFDQLTDELHDRVVQVPFGPQIPVTLHYGRCSNCAETGDFDQQNGPLVEAAMAESTQKSIPPMVETIKGYGYTVVYCERALRLPFGTFQKWLDNPESVDLGAVVMLRMVATYPWLLQAADDNFKQPQPQ